jgi:ABC-type glycerol-3-phosphate transport system substrate-binding protein
VAGGTPPDGAANYNYMDYILRGVLSPLDSYINASTKIKKDDFLEAVWDIGVYEGKNYGLPANECFVQLGFCYNAKLVSDAGLDPDTPPETWDDLYAWHEKITTFDSAGNVKIIGYNPTDFMGEAIWGSSAWDVSTSWGFEWYDEAAATFNLNNEHLVDYFDTSKRFVDLIGVDNLTAFSSVQGQGSWGPAFYSGVLATMLNGYWEPGELAAVDPELSANNRASWLPVPERRRGVKAQGAGGHIVMVFKDAKNNEMMYKVCEWLNEDAVCDVIFNSMGWLPARKSYLDQVDPNTYNGLEFFLRSATETTSWGNVIKCPITTYVSVTYTQLRDQVYRGQLSAQEAAAELQKRCEDELRNQGFAK